MDTIFYFLESVLLFHIISNTPKNTLYRQFLLLQWYNGYNGTIVILERGCYLFESSITF